MTVVMNVEAKQGDTDCQGVRYTTYRSILGDVVLEKDFSAIIQIFQERLGEARDYGTSCLGTMSDYLGQFTETTNYIHQRYGAALSAAHRENNLLKIVIAVMTVALIALGITMLVVLL